ncbi:unnamed protein product [Ceutorhynchus assimilis]|uniref:Regulatory protein zeste n=1 Tax=Ceutorhynchus assimilis TaxID=467358 RepID=A0A9N9QIB7_9CUCU|nr:unnamed protein product [Ceutorhynchus assimilis]
MEGWRKALTDWKSKTKSKAAAIKREMQKTGGGSNDAPPLSILENKLLAIMGTKSVFGDEEVPEIGFGNHDNDGMQKKVFGCKTESGPAVELRNKTPINTSDSIPVTQNKPQNQVHDYGQGSGKENDCIEDNEDGDAEQRTVKKTKLVSPTKSIRRRPQQTLHLSSELIQLNRETVEMFKILNANTESIANNTERIVSNTQSIASSLNIIANVLQK